MELQEFEEFEEFELTIGRSPKNVPNDQQILCPKPIFPPCNVGYSCGVTFQHWGDENNGRCRSDKQYRTQLKSYISNEKAQRILDALSAAGQAQYPLGITYNFLAPYFDNNVQAQLTVTTPQGVPLQVVALQGIVPVLSTFIEAINLVRVTYPGSSLVEKRYLTSNDNWFLTWNEVVTFYDATGNVILTGSAINQGRIDNCSQLVTTAFWEVQTIFAPLLLQKKKEELM